MTEILRLEKLISMLDSDFDGERSNAAQMIRHLAKRRGMSMIELFRAEFGGNKPHIIPYKPVSHRRRDVEIVNDEVAEVPEAERQLLNQLAELRDNHRTDDRDERFIDNILGGFTRDDQLSPTVEARVRKIVRG